MEDKITAAVAYKMKMKWNVLASLMKPSNWRSINQTGLPGLRLLSRIWSNTYPSAVLCKAVFSMNSWWGGVIALSDHNFNSLQSADLISFKGVIQNHPLLLPLFLCIFCRCLFWVCTFKYLYLSSMYGYCFLDQAFVKILTSQMELKTTEGALWKALVNFVKAFLNQTDRHCLALSCGREALDTSSRMWADGNNTNRYLL